MRAPNITTDLWKHQHLIIKNATIEPITNYAYMFKQHNIKTIPPYLNNSTKTMNDFSHPYEDLIMQFQGSLIIFLNVSLIAFLLRKKLRANHSTKLFLNLQFTHITIALSAVTFGINRGNAALILNSCILMEMFVSLMMATIDRLVSIKYHFLYQKVTTKYCMIGIASSWIFPVLLLCVDLNVDIQEYYYSALSTTLIATATLTLAASNITVYGIVRRHIRMIKRNAVNDRNNTANMKRSLKLAKSTCVCFAIVTSFVIFWFPFLVHDVLVTASIYKPSKKKSFTFVIEVFALCNSALDPILFVLLSKNVKREILACIRKNEIFKQSKKISIRTTGSTDSIVVSTFMKTQTKDEAN